MHIWRVTLNISHINDRVPIYIYRGREKYIFLYIYGAFAFVHFLQTWPCALCGWDMFFLSRHRNLTEPPTYLNNIFFKPIFQVRFVFYHWECFDLHFQSFGTCMCVCISLRSTWSHLEWLELSWTHLDSMNLNRTQLISLGPIWTVTVPLAVAAAEVAVVFASHSFCCSFDKTPCRSRVRSFDEYSLQPPAEGPGRGEGGARNVRARQPAAGQVQAVQYTRYIIIHITIKS